MTKALVEISHSRQELARQFLFQMRTSRVRTEESEDWYREKTTFLGGKRSFTTVIDEEYVRENFPLPATDLYSTGVSPISFAKDPQIAVRRLQGYLIHNLHYKLKSTYSQSPTTLSALHYFSLRCHFGVNDREIVAYGEGPSKASNMFKALEVWD